MKEVDTLLPFCYPLSDRVDMLLLLDSVNTLLNRLGLTLDDINERCKTKFGFAINLTHLPELVGDDRWNKYTGKHASVIEQDVNESDFTEHLSESQDLYIGKLVHKIYNQHTKKFQGRAQLIWLGSNQNYNFHKDFHTPNRYHIPLITNTQCFWLLKRHPEIVKLHMPADGRIWYLDPSRIEHTFCNQSDTARLHLLLTSGF
jgi:hypothetical protein